MDSSSAVAISYKEHTINQIQSRVSEQEKLFDYYIGDKSSLLQYLREVQEITFNEGDIDEMQSNFLNITKKVINQLAIVYRESAKRQILSEGKLDEDSTNEYNSIIPRNINTIDKMAHRYAKLQNTSLTRIYFEDGKIKYEIRSSHLYDVVTSDDNPYKITELSYQRYFKNEKNEDELYKVYWTDKEHYRKKLVKVASLQNVGLDKIPIGNNSDMINPYGVIPFADLRLEMQGNYWGSGATDLVNINEQINFLLSDLINGGIIMQAWGTLVFQDTGLGLPTNNNPKGNIQNLRVGPKHPIAFETQNSEKSGSVSVVNGNPLIADVMNVIDWMIKLIAITKGLNPNSFLADAKATSGYSKVIDSLEQLEMRQDDIEPCREYEDVRFDITKKILNYHISTGEITNYKPLDEDTYLQVTFSEITVPKTTEEQIAQDEYDLKMGIVSVIDIARRQFPDLEDAEIEKKILANKEITKKFTAEVKPEIEPLKETEKEIPEDETVK